VYADRKLWSCFDMHNTTSNNIIVSKDGLLMCLPSRIRYFQLLWPINIQNML
jgi:hypothetical protein